MKNIVANMTTLPERQAFLEFTKNFFQLTKN